MPSWNTCRGAIVQGLTDLCKELEAFETDPWAAREILDYELMTPFVLDPCCGTGALADAARDRGHRVLTFDIFDWSTIYPCEKPDNVMDFLTYQPMNLGNEEFTVFMNPPFSKACAFVDKAMEIGARKIVSFQAWSWRSSVGRNEWWIENPPARIWLCVDRATCFRFDVPTECIEPETCSRKKSKKDAKCRLCMGSTPTTHAFFVWEAGHTGASIICNLRKPKLRKEP